MNKGKTALVGLLGIIIGVLAGFLCQPFAKPVLDVFGVPKVTIVNVTGEDISKITISLGPAQMPVPALKNGHARTVKISERFSETSVRISWTDSTGTHEEDAGGYMEASGFYHEKIALTPDRKARAFYEMRESSIH